MAWPLRTSYHSLLDTPWDWMNQVGEPAGVG